MDLITIDTRSSQEEEQSKATVKKLIDEFGKTDLSSLNTYNPPFIEGNKSNLLAIGNKHRVKKEMKGISTWKTNSHKISIFVQIFILFQKLAINMLRDRSLIIGKLLEPILMGLSVAYIFFQLESTVVDIQASIAAIYAAVSLQPYLILLAILIQCNFSFNL